MDSNKNSAKYEKQGRIYRMVSDQAEITEAEEIGLVVKDANGNLLQDEDSVVVL